MSFVKTTLSVLLGCVLGAMAIYAVDKCVDSIFVSEWKEVGGLAPLFSVFEYLFTRLIGIVLGGITLALMARRQFRSFALLLLSVACSIGIIILRMPFQHLLAYSPATVLPFDNSYYAAQKLLQALYWTMPLVWSLALTAYLIISLRRRATPSMNFV